MEYETSIELYRENYFGSNGGTPNYEVFVTGWEDGRLVWTSPFFTRSSIWSAKRLVRKLIRNQERILAA